MSFALPWLYFPTARTVPLPTQDVSESGFGRRQHRSPFLPTDSARRTVQRNGTSTTCTIRLHNAFPSRLQLHRCTVSKLPERLPEAKALCGFCLTLISHYSGKEGPGRKGGEGRTYLLHLPSLGWLAGGAWRILRIETLAVRLAIFTTRSVHSVHGGLETSDSRLRDSWQLVHNLGYVREWKRWKHDIPFFAGVN